MIEFWLLLVRTGPVLLHHAELERFCESLVSAMHHLFES